MEHDISMCGILPTVITMETQRLLGNLKKAKRTGHAASADVNGDANRVVGHVGMFFV